MKKSSSTKSLNPSRFLYIGTSCVLVFAFLASCQAVPANPARPGLELTPVIPTPSGQDGLSTDASGEGTVETPAVDYSLKLAWFYKPATNASELEIVQNFRFFIMSKGNENDRDAMLMFGAEHPMLRYIRMDAIMNPGDCNDRPAQNQAAFKAGDFCDINANHPDWFLLDENGQRIIRNSSDKDYYFMDPGNAGWREFFIKRLWEVYNADANWDGVFLDNMETSFDFRVGRNEIPKGYTEESYVAAIQGFVKLMREEFFLPANQIVFANIVAKKSEDDFTNHLTYLDGAMHESWVLSNSDGYRSLEEWEAQLEAAERTQAMGKTIVLVAQGFEDNTEMQKFALASYYLINQGSAVFRYTRGGSYNQAWLYDNYRTQLGTPLGPRYLDGDTWRRDFENGSVSVNPKTHEAQIVTKQ